MVDVISYEKAFMRDMMPKIMKEVKVWVGMGLLISNIDFA